LAGFPSQLPDPALHVGTQSPAVHVVVPFEFEHAAPQAPQFVAVLSGVSQPFTGSPSQLPNPAAHTGAQSPATHDVVPCVFRHVFPHAPQLVVVA
jgi:hypothetical protein